MVACVLIPRFALIAAVGDRRALLARPVALAPEPGGEQAVGEVSGAAEAFGVRVAMSLSEALSRCPGLVLVPPDPGRSTEAWERALRGLEGIGAEVESGCPGEAFFEADGLRGLWGGDVEGVLARARGAVGMPVRLGAGASRFCALAAAGSARARSAGRRGRRAGGAAAGDAGGPAVALRGRGGSVIVPRGAERAFLSPLPVGLLHDRLAGPGTRSTTARRRDERDGAAVVRMLERLGVGSLGELAALPRTAIADRFGRLGLRARDLARGEDSPLLPRRPHGHLAQRLELPEAASGRQLERALGLLVDRLLALPERRGRTIRALVIEAFLAAGGSWRSAVALRRASASAERIRLALAPRLVRLPGPAGMLGLRAVSLGSPAADQPSLLCDERERRRERLAEAVRQARAACGRDAVLRVVEVDSDSRVPERWAILAPFPEVFR